MSPEKNQEYVGNGVADDIITSLSRISNLKVIGRTSFQFKGEKIDIREIREQLGVSTVLEERPSDPALAKSVFSHLHDEPLFIAQLNRRIYRCSGTIDFSYVMLSAYR